MNRNAMMTEKSTENGTLEAIERIVRSIRVSENRQRLFLDGQDQTDLIGRKMLEEGYIFDTSDLRALLQVWIYRLHYIRPGQPPIDEPTDIDRFTYADTGIKFDFWNTGSWRYTTGSSRPSRFSNEVVLLKGSKARWVSGGQYFETGIAKESGWIVLESNEPTHQFGSLSDGVKFNWVYGRHLSDDDDRGFIRFYFNLKPTKAAAACLVREIQNCFNLHEVPFILKFIGDPEKCDRADSSVLYTDHRYLNLVTVLLQNIYLELHRNSALRENVPLFTRQLAPGLGVAEEPDTGTSFGLDRSFQLADALIAVGTHPETEIRKNAVLDFLRAKEFDPNHFYKNPSSPVQFQFLFDHFEELDRVARGEAGPGGEDDGFRVVRFRLIDETDWFGQPGFSRKPYLLAALRIAIQLCREAIWYYDDRTGNWSCNWLTYRPTPDRKNVTYRLLDDSFEEGVSGIRFFLNTVLIKCYQSELLAFVIANARPAGSAFESLEGLAEPVWTLKDPDLEQGLKVVFEKPVQNPGTSQHNLNGTVFISSKEVKEVQNGMSNDLPDEKVADALIERYLNQGRPLGNGYGESEPERSDLFCPNFRFGLAGLGYYFLRVYDPRQFKPIALSKP
ncbi:T3SS effector HopA1 family protein [Larkinella humicola]|uniref:Uncharacterized protein n=1 Tax=Larkinella humicola TaxID=2607654 RepID=A0A5N1J3K2_9BACT|nr:T3SS effector HopA1 family protein [Larkinella humicola]KAA9345476.1 hypothetical protein F0P93_29950 [Larkinella humicola]